jgi:hypothetical protein
MADEKAPERKVEKEKRQNAHEFAVQVLGQVMRNEIDMSDARKLMHEWWRLRRGLGGDPREQAIEFRKQLERITLIAGELHTEFQVASQTDR